MRSLDDWFKLLNGMCSNSQFNAILNGNGKGVAIVPKGFDGPQRICVYPKPTVGPGLAIEEDVYKLISAHGLLVHPDRTQGKDTKRYLYNNLYEDDVIDICQLFINSCGLLKPTKSLSHINNEELLADTKNELKDITLFEDIDKEISNLNVLGDERDALVKIRVNQSVFRDRLLNRYGKCCICGVSTSEFLIASHIKPWKLSENSERVDVDNGFLFCPNHDKLFDRGYISFDNEGKILISESLSEVDTIFMNVNRDMKIKLTDGNKQYLNEHRKLHLFE